MISKSEYWRRVITLRERGWVIIRIERDGDGRARAVDRITDQALTDWLGWPELSERWAAFWLPESYVSADNWDLIPDPLRAVDDSWTANVKLPDPTNEQGGTT